MTGARSSFVDPYKAMLGVVFGTSAGPKALKQDFHMVIVNERHLYQAILTLQNDDGQKFTREGLRAWHWYHRNGYNITTAEAIRLTKVANIMTTIQRRDASCLYLLAVWLVMHMPLEQSIISVSSTLGSTHCP